MHDSIKNLKRSYNWISLGYVILGAVFLFWPELSLMTLCYAFGTLTIVYGIVHLITYFVRDRMISVFRYDMVIGIIAVILGILIVGPDSDLESVRSSRHPDDVHRCKPLYRRHHEPVEHVLSLPQREEG